MRSVILQPLNDEQINQYLQETNALNIQKLIDTDQEWRELAQTPLFLDIMVLANDKKLLYKRFPILLLI
jgi:hypothetical protein